MRFYLDDDSASGLLIRLLVLAGHDAETPEMAGLRGKDDPAHLLHAATQDRVLLSHNHDDFQSLHHLVVQTGGVHPGIMIVRCENKRRRDMTYHGIAHAIENVIAAGVPIENQFIILNHWR